MFCYSGGVLGPRPPFDQRATTRIAGTLACPYDGDRAGIALFNSQHSATEYAGDSSAVGQDFGQPVTGARMGSWVTHERFVREQPAKRRSSQRPLARLQFPVSPLRNR